MNADVADPPPARPLPPRTGVVDRRALPSEVLELAFQAVQVDGTQPFVRELTLPHPLAPLTLQPPHAHLERAVTTDTTVTALFRLPSASILVDCWMRSTTVTISASSHEQAAELERQVRARAPLGGARVTVWLRTWFRQGAHTAADDRRIEAPAWGDIQGNYPPIVRSELDRLLAVVRPTGTGKLVLWHGEPGTGKTTALRALLRAWGSWCAGQYIVDPEHFFADPGYITQVLSRAPAPRCGPSLTQTGDPDTLWRLVIAEDCDDYLNATTRDSAGAGLARLLNLADGVLGQGLHTLLLLTTNQGLDEIHPALTRPGRCLARLNFDRFSPNEAREWLGPQRQRPTAPRTLAELFALRGSVSNIGQRPGGNAAPTGQYL